MDEVTRKKRNTERLAECHPGFRAPLGRVLAAMEKRGFRPRIQDAWRSQADQLRAFNAGTSKLRYGLHNATGPGGRKEALAADVLDDDHPTAPPLRYLIALAIAAADAGLETGILWGLSAAWIARTSRAIQARNIDANVRVGWDPTHVQVRGFTAAAARAGARPVVTGTATPAPQEEDDMFTDEDRRLLRKIANAGELVAFGDDHEGPDDKRPGYFSVREVYEKLAVVEDTIGALCAEVAALRAAGS